MYATASARRRVYINLPRTPTMPAPTYSGPMDVYPLLPSFRQGILITAVSLLFYTLVRVVYNVFFHPLSRFPGPRGAACTRWWLAYKELGRGVSLSTLRAELHQKYGMSYPRRSFNCSIDAGQGDIIRIAPNEVNGTNLFGNLGLAIHCLVSSQLHFSRPTVYNEIYNSQNKWDKDYEYYRAFELDEAFFTQTDYLKSKHSRGLISNLFSRGAISEIQHLITDQVRSMYPVYVFSVTIDFVAGSIL